MYRIGRLRLYLAIFAVLILESTAFHSLNFGNTRPNLMLVFVIFVGLYSDWQEALEAGIAGGLLRGALSTGAVGVSLSIFSMASLIAAYSKNKVFRESFLTQIALSFSIALVFNAAVVMSWRIVKTVEMINVTIRDIVVSKAVLISLYTALITPLSFFFFKRVLRVREPGF